VSGGWFDAVHFRTSCAAGTWSIARWPGWSGIEGGHGRARATAVRHWSPGGRRRRSVDGSGQDGPESMSDAGPHFTRSALPPARHGDCETVWCKLPDVLPHHLVLCFGVIRRWV